MASILKKRKEKKKDNYAHPFFYNFFTTLNNLNNISLHKYWQISKINIEEKGNKNIDNVNVALSSSIFFHNFSMTLNNLNNILLHKHCQVSQRKKRQKIFNYVHSFFYNFSMTLNNLNNTLLLKQIFKKRKKKDRQCKRDFTSIFFIIFYNFSTILNNLNSRKKIAEKSINANTYLLQKKLASISRKRDKKSTM